MKKWLYKYKNVIFTKSDSGNTDFPKSITYILYLYFINILY